MNSITKATPIATNPSQHLPQSFFCRPAEQVALKATLPATVIAAAPRATTPCLESLGGFMWMLAIAFTTASKWCKSDRQWVSVHIGAGGIKG